MADPIEEILGDYRAFAAQQRLVDGFHHVDGWVPQRLVTATGSNPLPR